MTVRIQINSLAALEHLLENYSGEIELELRSNIVYEFTKKYLKGLVNEDELQKQATQILKNANEISKLIDERINAVVEKYIINVPYWSNSKCPVSLTSTAKELVKQAVYDLADDELKKGLITSLVDKLVNQIDVKGIKSEIKEILLKNIGKL